MTQDKGGTGGKHTGIVQLRYCTLRSARGGTEGPSVLSVWKTSHPPVGILCVFLQEIGQDLLAAQLLWQTMQSGRTSDLSAPFPGGPADRFSSCKVFLPLRSHGRFIGWPKEGTWAVPIY